MHTPELAEIDASLLAIVRRAYDLGRSDALKKVVDVLNADTTPSEPLALTGPDASNGAATHQNMSEPERVESSPPWWAWPVR